jgi:predicted transcriptional regulator
MTRIITALLATLALAGATHAEDLQPLRGKSIELGATTGVAYYTVADDGFRVVATLAAGEAVAPVRFVATLSSGQSVVLSVPQASNEAAREVEIKRTGDAITVSDVSGKSREVGTQ